MKRNNHLPNTAPACSMQLLEEPIYIGIMGMTGVGKSTFINTVCGEEVAKVGRNLESCTEDIQVTSTTINDREVVLIDTPGFDDTDRTDFDICSIIANYLAKTDGCSVKLTGILYLHRIVDNRVGGSALKNLNMFRKLVGDDYLSNVVLATTMWDKVDPEDGKARQKELVKGKFWGGMMAAGASAVQLDGTRENAIAICTRLMENRPITLRIQQELRHHGLIADTAAGRVVFGELEKLKQKHEAELQELREMMQSFSNTQNLNLIKEIRAQCAELEKRLQAVNERQRALDAAAIKKLEEKIARLEEKRCSIM